MPIIKFTDLCLYIIAGILAFAIKFEHIHIRTNYQIVFIIAGLLFLMVCALCKVYQNICATDLVKQLRKLYFALIVVILSLVVLAFLLKIGGHFSRSWFFQWHIYAAILLTLHRLLACKILRTLFLHKDDYSNVLLIGSGELTQYIAQRVSEDSWSNFRIVSTIPEDEYYSLVQSNGLGVLENLLRDKSVNEVWVALEFWDKANIRLLMQSIESCVVTLRCFPNILGLDLLGNSISEIVGLPVINIIATPMSENDKLVKNIEDKLLSILIGLMLSPLCLIIAGLVKLDSPGPVFYRQRRVSWNGLEFDMLKFRSMPLDAEASSGAVWAQPEDQRATKFGAFLRKTSLDELPQFINVFKGDMSIVGPRPERPVFVEKFKHEIPGYMHKHFVKAGITGWAQVNGWRGNTDLTKRIECDLYYINNWSLLFDFKIIFLTVFRIFRDKNAY